MSTEKSLKRLISLYAGKIIRLRGEIEGTIARKKDAEVQLRELRWEAKGKKVSLSVKECNRLRKAIKPYPDRIDKAD